MQIGEKTLLTTVFGGGGFFDSAFGEKTQIPGALVKKSNWAVSWPAAGFSSS